MSPSFIIKRNAVGSPKECVLNALLQTVFLAILPTGKPICYSSSVFCKTFLFLSFRDLLYNLTSQMQPLFTIRDSIWTNELYETWIDLFGTPNHYSYPNLPYDAAHTRDLPKSLKLQVKVIHVSITTNPDDTVC